MSFRVLAAAAVLASTAMAKTDIAGCTSYDTVYTPGHGSPYATRIWYVPDTGEVCEFLDCGGGRAPPKTTVPGCAAYEGTETYSPSFIDPATLGQAPLKTTTAVTATSTADDDDEDDDEETGSKTATTAKETTTTASDSDDDDDDEESSSSSRLTTSAPSASDSTSSPSASTTDAASEASNTASDIKDTASATTSSESEEPTGAAAVQGVALLGSCLFAGVAACFALL